jgi:MFS family permease
VVGYAVREFGWRKAALAIGIVLAVVIAPMPLLRRIGRGDDHAETGRAEIVGMALGAAMKTTVFWLFVAGICAFAFVSSGLGLFNESVLAERGFDRKTFEMFLVSTTLAALVGQLLCGWLGKWHQSRFLLAEALALYGIGLAALPLLTQPWQLWLTAAGVGISAGMMTVLFFSVWGETFGEAQLGRIQGVAQMCTVVASAAGPVVFANTQQATGSYQRVLWVTTAVVVSLAVLSCVIVVPKRSG